MTRQWTDKQIAVLRSITDGITYGAIAAQLGIPRKACIAKAAELGFRSAYKTPKRQQFKKRSILSDVVFRHAPRPLKPLPVESYNGPPLIALVDLDDRHCRWPIGDPRSPGFGFCGQLIRDGRSFLIDREPYCVKHHALAVTRQTESV